MIIIRDKNKASPIGISLLIRGGLTTLVDPDLYEFLDRFKWFPLKSAHSVYVCTRKIVKGKVYTIRIHRLITQAPAWMKVHHINHDTFDNRLDNLSVITEREHRHFDGWHIFLR